MEFEKILESQAAKEKAEMFPGVEKETRIVARSAMKFDTRGVMANLKALETNCDKLISEANGLVIDTAEEKMEAANLSGDLQELGKKVKKQCEDFLEPYKKVSTAINGVKKRIIDAATSAKNIVMHKIMQYKKQEELNQAKQQQIINEQAKDLQEKLRVQATELKIEVPKVAPIKAPKPVTVIHGDSGASIYSRKAWKCQIITPEDVNREYCLPSQKLLNEAVKMGVRKTPGCRIYQAETPVTRTG